jgi:antitoxin YefM
MIARTYSDVRTNFKTYCDKAVNDFETIIVTRKENNNVVIMSEAEYNNLIENMAILSNRKYYDKLMKSKEQIEKGLCKKRELIEE